MIIVIYFGAIVFLSIILGELKFMKERKHNKWEQMFEEEMNKKLK